MNTYWTIIQNVNAYIMIHKSWANRAFGIQSYCTYMYVQACSASRGLSSRMSANANNCRPMPYYAYTLHLFPNGSVITIPPEVVQITIMYSSIGWDFFLLLVSCLTNPHLRL